MLNINKIKKKETAFTLAELLITLVIIGVIAAVTIPNLISNYREKAYKTAWKKAYADFGNVALRIASDYNVDTFQEAQNAVISEMNLNKNESYDRTIATLELLKKYFKHTEANTDTSRGFRCGNVPFFPNRNRYKYLNGKEIGSDWNSATLFNYGACACLKTQNYTFSVSADASSWGGHVTVKVSPYKTLGVVGKDMFFIDIRNLRKILPNGVRGFDYGTDYTCSSGVGHGGFACSAKYLYEK